MRRVIGIVLAIGLALVSQLAIARWIPWLADRLDPFLIVVVYYGAAGSQVTAMLTGAASGLIQDVWFGSLLGQSGFRKVLTGYLVGAVGSRFSLESAGARFATLAAATLLDHVAGLALGEFMGRPLAPRFPFIVFERVLVNAIAGTACYALVGRFSKAGERRPGAGGRSAARRGR